MKKILFISFGILILVIAAVASAQFLSPFPSYSSSEWDTYGGTYGGGGGGYTPSFGTIIDPSIYGGSGSTGGSTGDSTSGNTEGSAAIDVGTSYCKNSVLDLKPPKDAVGVKLQDVENKLVYLGVNDPVKTLDPKGGEIMVLMIGTPKKIVMTRIENEQELQRELGEITVDNNCYPKYGYIYASKLWWDYTGDFQAPSPEMSEPPPDYSYKTAVNVNPETGQVFDAATGELITDARYDKSSNEIYYKDTDSFFGIMVTETSGYVNIKKTIFTSVSMFKDVPSSETHILGLIDMMLKQKTLKKSPKFYPDKLTDADFSLKIMGTLSEEGCSAKKKYKTSKKCRSYLLKKGIIDKNFPKGKKKLIRGEFYAAIFRALDIPLEESTQETRDLVKSVCSDAENPSDRAVSILATAIKYGMAKTYDGKCRPLDNFPRWEAAEFAMRLNK